MANPGGAAAPPGAVTGAKELQPDFLNGQWVVWESLPMHALVSGVAGSSLGLCSLFCVFAHIHVSFWQSPSGTDWEVAFN